MLFIKEIYIIWLYFVGTCLGSFLYCAVSRTYDGKEFVKTPSHCDNCGHKLSPLELIPVFSYIYLRGKCKHCSCSIPIYSTLVEILTGITLSTLGIYIVEYHFALLSWTRCIIIIFILISAVTDMVNGEVPYTLQVCMVIISSISVISPRDYRTNLPKFSEVDPLIYLNIPVAWIIFGIAILASCIFYKYIGQGDIIIFTSIGLCLSFWSAVIAVTFSCLLALLFYLARGSKSSLIRTDVEEMSPGYGIRLVPFIFVTSLIVLILQPSIDYVFLV